MHPENEPHHYEPDDSAGPRSFGRRSLLSGAVAAAALGLLAACGGGGGDGDDGGGASAGAGDGGDGEPLPQIDEASGIVADGRYLAVQRFPSTVAVPGEVRLPFSIQRDASFVNDGPDTLSAQVVDIDGAPVGEPISAVRRDVSPAAYYVWRPTITEPGIYSLVVDGGPPEGAAFQVFEPGQVDVPLAGEQLSDFDTPTPDDPNGVDPICTRDPICPFHETTLTEALESGRRVVYLIGTPAFCQTGTCAPALEAMVDLAEDFSDDFVFVHAEVFTDLTAQELTPAIVASGVAYEPVLFITDTDRTIVERIDTIWDESELRERLDLARA